MNREGTEIKEYLRSNIGKEVEVEYVQYGTLNKIEGKLRDVGECGIEIGSGRFLVNRIPFIGYGTAIQEIRGKNGEVLYKNPSI